MKHITKLHNSLYAIVDTTFCPQLSHQDLALQYLQGGANILQLREKRLPKNEIIKIAIEITNLKNRFDFTWIINDDPQIAQHVDADGVHLGQNDMVPAMAREILGSEKLIGYSTHSLKQFQQALKLDIDYIAIGAVFSTKSKPKDHPRVGIETLKQVIKLSHLPVVAIGGISRNNIQQVLQTGINNIALISALTQAKDIESEVRYYVNRITRTLCPIGHS